MQWLDQHRMAIGILADSLTFAGGALLARDAFLRLQALRKGRTDIRFRETFPGLNLTDRALREAIASLGWTLAGFALLSIGFACQLLLRFVEP